MEQLNLRQREGELIVLQYNLSSSMYIFQILSPMFFSFMYMCIRMCTPDVYIRFFYIRTTDLYLDVVFFFLHAKALFFLNFFDIYCVYLFSVKNMKFFHQTGGREYVIVGFSSLFLRYSCFLVKVYTVFFMFFSLFFFLRERFFFERLNQGQKMSENKKNREEQARAIKTAAG